MKIPSSLLKRGSRHSARATRGLLAGNNLSIRTKILGGYSFVIVLFFAIILNIIVSQRDIQDKLRLVNEDYIPKLTIVNTLGNYAHLEDSFSVEKIIENRSNNLLLQTVSISHPKLLENKLSRFKSSVERSRQRVSNPRGDRFLDLILKSAKSVGNKHSEYVKETKKIISLVKKGDIKSARSCETSLENNKRILKSEINLLRRRLDNTIRSWIFQVSISQKRTAIITAVLSLLAIIIAGAITLFALFTLAPIKRLIKGVQKISQGDYDFRFDIKSGGEVKMLADEFNSMSRSILERNNRLREQQKKLIQSERMAVVGRMASHITHEIKNPLNSMSLNSELLEDEIKELISGKDPGEAFDLIKSIRKEIGRLSVISDEYLSYSRLPKGENDRIEINAFLKEITSFLRKEIESGNIELDMQLAEDLPSVVADTSQLKKAIMNILKNAIEAITGGGTINVRTSMVDGRISITISDSGEGIAPDIIDNIFDPFFSTKEKGSGLGLPLTQKIINEQGGEITCKSKPGKGTTFRIYMEPYDGERPLRTNV